MAKIGRSGLRLLPLFRRKLLGTIICGSSFTRKKTNFDPPKNLPSSVSKRSNQSDRLSELLKAEALICEVSVRANVSRKEMFLEEVKNVVKKLEVEVSKKVATSEVRRMAKDDVEAREMLAMVGAIPPIAGMVDSDNVELRVDALYALLNLSIGNDLNKAAIVKAGVVHKMMKMIESECVGVVSEAVVANFLALSALKSNQCIIGASGAIEFLVKTFKNSKAGTQLKLDSIRSMCNLSNCDMNVTLIVESGLLEYIFQTIGDSEVSDKMLVIVSNIVAFSEGRRAVSRMPEWTDIMVDVLNWCDLPECQERAAYILMIMAYKGRNHIPKMIESGMVSALLELTLMGNALAQKRASRILEILRVDKGKQISEGFAQSDSLSSISTSFSEGKEGNKNLSEERKAVKELVQQSLQHNMRRIASRANLPQESVPSARFLTVNKCLSTTSKSLPF